MTTRFTVEQHGEKYLIYELDEGQRVMCGRLMIPESHVAELLRFLRTSGERWRGEQKIPNTKEVVTSSGATLTVKEEDD